MSRAWGCWVTALSELVRSETDLRHTRDKPRTPSYTPSFSPLRQQYHIARALPKYVDTCRCVPVSRSACPVPGCVMFRPLRGLIAAPATVNFMRRYKCGCPRHTVFPPSNLPHNVHSAPLSFSPSASSLFVVRASFNLLQPNSLVLQCRHLPSFTRHEHLFTTQNNNNNYSPYS
jgi:hypothetical protein